MTLGRPRSALGILLALLGLQFALSGALGSHAPDGDAQLSGHAPAVTLLQSSAPPALELEDGEADPRPGRSPHGIDDRHAPAARDARPDGLTPWRATDALARAGRLSAPSTAPPLSGA